MLLSKQFRRNSPGKRDEGYILLFLLLIIAIMAIMAATLVTSIKFEVKRDREEEMVHRGVQYTRAIRAYYRKFNRFPTKIEDLENTNQLRFLRKRYKDPLTGKEFKVLRFGDVKLAGLGVMGGGMIPGANMVGANGAMVSANAAGLPQTPGYATSAFGAPSPTAFGTPSSPGFGQSSNSPFGQSPTSTLGQNQPSDNQSEAVVPSASPSSQSGTSGGEPGSQGSQPVSAGDTSGSGDRSSPNQQVFGGAPMVGVASTSKEKTIREFDKKKKYDEWLFVYDPMLDRGGLIKTPYQPQLMRQMMSQGMQNVSGQNPGQNNSGFNNSGFGNNGGFGNSTGFANSPGNSPGGMQNNPNSPGGLDSSNPSPATNSPQQQ